MELKGFINEGEATRISLLLRNKDEKQRQEIYETLSPQGKHLVDNWKEYQEKAKRRSILNALLESADQLGDIEFDDEMIAATDKLIEDLSPRERS